MQETARLFGQSIGTAVLARVFNALPVDRTTVALVIAAAVAACASFNRLAARELGGALEEQGVVRHYGECIRKTIADIQRRTMPAFAEAVESANRNLGMLRRDGHDLGTGQRKESLELRTPRVALSAFDDARHFYTCNG